MKHRITRKITLGILMAFVLAFGVPGIADALKFSRSSPSSSGDLQTVFANRDFKISFSVSSGSNTTSIKDRDGKLIKDSTDTGGGANHRIDSSGYLVENIGGTDYRISSAAQALDASTFSGTSPAFYYKKGDNYVAATTSNFLVNSSKAVYQKVTADNKAYRVYLRTGDDPYNYTTSGVTAEPNEKVPDANRYHYNQEQLQITVPSNLTLKKINSYTVNLTADHTMNEAKNSVNEDKISGSISLTYTASQVGTYDIIIRDQTPESDRPGAAAPDLVFRVFVVKDIGAVQNTTTSFEDNLDGVEYGYDTQDWQLNEDDDDSSGSSYFDFGTEDAPVTYSVDGSGRLYMKLGDRVTSLTKTLHTSSDAPVYLDMSGGTNRVTAYVAGNTGKTAIFIFSGATSDRFPRIEITQGHNQVGAAGGRLEQHLEVKVTDGRRSAVPGVAVQFAGTGENAMFIPVPGTTVYGTNAALAGTLTDPMNAATYVATATAPPKKGTPVFIQTDRSGLAKVYYELGASPTSQTITATLPGDPLTGNIRDTKKDFTARLGIAGSERVANLEILSGNPQSGEKGKNLNDPLVVIARSTAGYRIPNVVIQFTTSIGTLSRHGLTAKPIADDNNSLVWGEIPANTPNPDSGQQIYVITGSDGEASVSYQIGQYTIARQVSAEIRHEPLDSDYSFAIKRVTFNINGTGSTTPTTPTTTPTTPTPTTFTVSPSTITGAPGSTQALTVTTPSGSTAQIGNIVFGQFLNAGGSASPTTGTGSFTSTLTLPSTAGTYNLIVNVGSDRRTVSVTVSTTTATAQTGTLNVSVPFSGAPGSQQQTTVTATDSDGNAASGVVVTLAVTNGGGAFSPASVTTRADGTATSTLTRGTASGTNYFVTATATGYTEYRTRLSITGGSTPPATTTPTTPTTGTTPTVSGPPSSLVINGQAIRSGVTLNQQLAAPLVVEVLDRNSRSVADARVIFRVQSGQGRLSQRGNGRAVAVETDSRGYARATYTPMSANSTVEASVRGVAEPVTFTITTGEATTATGTSDTAGAKTYKRGDEIPISLDATLTFSGSRTISGTVYTCDSSGECVVSYGTLVKGEIKAAAVPKVEAKTYKRGDEIPISLDATLTFSGSRTISGMTYTCVGSGECVVSYGTLVKGEIQAAAPTPSTTPALDGMDISAVEMRVPASNRPVMYSVAGGALYLLGAEVTEIAASATDVAVGSNKVYWIEQTGDRTGTIHTANLDGTGKDVVRQLTSPPKGLTLANGKLYLTNGWGKIQRMNTDGTGFETDFITGLGTPMRIAVSANRAYWTDSSGRVRHAPLQGPKTVRDIVTGSGTLGGIVVDAQNVYWTETTGERSGRVRQANLNGTGVRDAYTVSAPLHGLAIDPAKNQLYWTNGWGKVQRGAPTRGDVVEGLMTPTALAIGGANTAPTPTPTKTPTQTADKSQYDVNGDGVVDNRDSAELTDALASDDPWSNAAKYDVDRNGRVDIFDLVALNRQIADGGGAPTATRLGVQLSTAEIDRLQAQIDLLIASNDQSPTAIKTLIYLQQLIATARPEKTQLLANYPNPFNPETWIPYELGTDTNVKITIYNAQGVVIRTLQLGQQSAGYYTDRERAAYWDGRNALGEQVASGIYFYQLETDEMSSLRKMVILK